MIDKINVIGIIINIRTIFIIINFLFLLIIKVITISTSFIIIIISHYYRLYHFYLFSVTKIIMHLLLSVQYSYSVRETLILILTDLF